MLLLCLLIDSLDVDLPGCSSIRHQDCLWTLAPNLNITTVRSYLGSLSRSSNIAFVSCCCEHTANFVY